MVVSSQRLLKVNVALINHNHFFRCQQSHHVYRPHRHINPSDVDIDIYQYTYIVLDYHHRFDRANSWFNNFLSVNLPSISRPSGIPVHCFSLTRDIVANFFDSDNDDDDDDARWQQQKKIHCDCVYSGLCRLHMFHILCGWLGNKMKLPWLKKTPIHFVMR
jgi:hypothetical protein